MGSGSKYNLKNLDEGQLDAMWNMLRMGYQKSNIPCLKEHLNLLRQAMIQKTAGQRRGDPGAYVSFDDIGTICNVIVIEAMCLYLSGDLDKLEKLLELEQEKTTDEGAQN